MTEEDLTEIRNTGEDGNFCPQKGNILVMEEIAGFCLGLILQQDLKITSGW